MNARAIIEAETPREFFRKLPRRIDVYAFSGDWVVDGNSGQVNGFTPDYSSYDASAPDDVELMAEFEAIVKFDLEEYRRYWGDVPDGIDISDIAYWTDDGKYHQASESYRQDIKSGSVRR